MRGVLGPRPPFLGGSYVRDEGIIHDYLKGFHIIVLLSLVGLLLLRFFIDVRIQATLEVTP